MQFLKLSNFLTRFIYFIFMLVMIIGMMVNITFFQDRFFENSKALSIIMVAGVLFVFFFCLAKLLKKIPDYVLKIILVIIFLAYLLFEIYILTEFTPSLARDAFRMQVDSLAVAKKALPEWSIYYKMFSQNVLPVTFYGLCLRILATFNLTTMQMVKILCFVLGSVLYASLLFSVKIVSKSNVATVISAIGLFFAPFLWMYNLFVLYTDTPLMIVWALFAICWWILAQKKQVSTLSFTIWLLATFFLSLFGQLMKASFLISVAFAAVYLLLYLINNKSFPKKLGIMSAILVLAISLSFPIGQRIERKVRFVPDENYSYPILHWVTMGLNQVSKGRFISDDLDELHPPLGEMVPFFTKEEKEKLIKNRLEKRFFKQSFRRLVWQYLNKFGVLLYSGYTHTRYFDGFQRAPKWYQDHAFQIISKLGLLAQGLFLLLFGLAFWKIWRAFLAADFNLMIPVLIILAIVSFYGLIWEVNPRYAEVILGPLLMLIFAPNSPKTELKNKKTVSTIFFGIFAFSALVSLNALGKEVKEKVAIENENEHDSIVPNTMPTLGNLSNYGMLYGRQNIELPAQKEAVQKVTITGANFYSLRVMKKLQQKGTFLLRFKGHVIFRMEKFNPMENYLTIYRKEPFEPGTYELVWQNNRKKWPFMIVVQDSKDYPLSKRPITGIETNTPCYFIYSFGVLEN